MLEVARSTNAAPRLDDRLLLGEKRRRRRTCRWVGIWARRHSLQVRDVRSFARTSDDNEQLSTDCAGYPGARHLVACGPRVSGRRGSGRRYSLLLAGVAHRLAPSWVFD